MAKIHRIEEVHYDGGARGSKTDTFDYDAKDMNLLQRFMYYLFSNLISMNTSDFIELTLWLIFISSLLALFTRCNFAKMRKMY